MTKNNELTVDNIIEASRQDLQDWLVDMKPDTAGSDAVVTIDEIERVLRRDKIDYSPILEAYKEHPTEITVQIVPDVQFLLVALNANDENREPTWTHVRDLAQQMQRYGFKTYLSDFAITGKGKIANAGHSLRAFAAAYLPLDFYVFAELMMTPDKKGKMVAKIPSPLLTTERNNVRGFVPIDRDTVVIDNPDYDSKSKDKKKQRTHISVPASLDGRPLDSLTYEERIADYQEYLDRAFSGHRAANYITTEDGELELAKDGHLRQDPKDCVANLKLGLPGDSVHFYDTVLRDRQGAEQLQMTPFCRWMMSTMNYDSKLFSQVLKALWLRAKAELPSGKVPADFRYGSNKGGGRLDPKQFPALALMFAPELVRGWDVMTADRDEPFSMAWKGSEENGNWVLPNLVTPSFEKDLSVVLSVITRDEATRLLKELEKTTPCKLLRDLNKAHAKEQIGTHGKPSADYVQAVLVAVARGRTRALPQDVDKILKDRDYRGQHWDRGEPNEVGVSASRGRYDALVAIGSDLASKRGIKPDELKSNRGRKRSN